MSLFKSYAKGAVRRPHPDRMFRCKAYSAWTRGPVGGCGRSIPVTAAQCWLERGLFGPQEPLGLPTSELHHDKAVPPRDKIRHTRLRSAMGILGAGRCLRSSPGGGVWMGRLSRGSSMRSAAGLLESRRRCRQVRCPADFLLDTRIVGSNSAIILSFAHTPRVRRTITAGKVHCGLLPWWERRASAPPVIRVPGKPYALVSGTQRAIFPDGHAMHRLRL